MFASTPAENAEDASWLWRSPPASYLADNSAHEIETLSCLIPLTLLPAFHGFHITVLRKSLGRAAEQMQSIANKADMTVLLFISIDIPVQGLHL